MKAIKFKNSKLKFRNKLIISVLLTFVFICVIFNRISNYITFNMKNYIINEVKKENVLLLKESFEVNSKSMEDPGDLIKIVKNSKDEIVEVEFDMKKCSQQLSNITKYINAEVENSNYLGYRLDIPLGYITNNPLTMNLGPKVPIKIEISDVALGNVSTQVEAFGINNALIKISLEIYLKTSILYPFETLEETTTYHSLLASKIITGKVPDFYNGSISAKSDSIKLPMNES